MICFVALCLHIQKQRLDAPAVVADGPLRVLVVHESGTADAAEFGRLRTALQTSQQVASYMAAQGHVLEVLDKDLPGDDGRPRVNAAHLAGLTLPAVLLYPLNPLSEGDPIYRASIAPGASVESILQVVKEHE